MNNRYITRSLEPVVERAASQFPAVLLTGPRQSGKTTLLTHLFGTEYAYISLELPDVRASAVEDPRGFLDLYPPPVIFDEVQYAPDLLPYIKERIDSHRDETGQYLLTGSQNILLAEKITESLAGRVAVLRLLPLSRCEIAGHPDAALPWEREEKPDVRAVLTGEELWAHFLRGSYPELIAGPERDLNLWHASYVQTYLERDLRTLRQVGDLTQFQNFLRAMAARSAQLFNLTEMSRDLDVAVNTVKAWLSVLEATYQVIILRPYFTNIGKRLVKTPKVYFTDVGTLCYLVGLKDPGHAASGPLGGAILKTAVLSEVVKMLTHRGIDPQVYFWRTSTGREVDLLIESNGGLTPIEVKLSATPRPAMADSIRSVQQDLGDRTGPGYVIHTGDVRLPLGSDVTALPFGEL